jgi:hypothetical protein
MYLCIPLCTDDPDKTHHLTQRERERAPHCALEGTQGTGTSFLEQGVWGVRRTAKCSDWLGSYQCSVNWDHDARLVGCFGVLGASVEWTITEFVFGGFVSGP